MKGDFSVLELGRFCADPTVGFEIFPGSAKISPPPLADSACFLLCFDRDDHDWICWGEPYSEEAVFSLPTQLT